METFPEGLTQPAPFFAPKRKVEVPMMQHTTHHGYGELHGAQVLELTYTRGELSMRVAVPADENGLAKAEPLANEFLALPLRRAHVHLSMPRFRCESQFSLVGPLSRWGCRRYFGTATRISGIDGTRELFVSSISHKALVNVDEDGTEAAAATVLVSFMGAAFPSEPPIEVRVDRPFLFWIRRLSHEHRAVCWTGR